MKPQKSILLVDDEDSIRASLSKVLQAEDYEVLLAENGATAIEKYDTGRVDVLILDVNIPIKNGWVTLEWLAKVDPLLPVVIITSHSDQKALKRMAGADALMEKPLNVPLLLKTIREFVDEPMEQRAARAALNRSGFRRLACDEPDPRELAPKAPLNFDAARPETGLARPD